ncbi:hypothetical protein E2C01_087459 [Portunus trituberculatus]|uniref:Uncharacterized protein n=1 Tax=Portunus trituberculatus TaxID=210409 RepID=A0A5B7JDF1_PORTR|nr:hypothetical protein [Portunus trituberculatus]
MVHALYGCSVDMHSQTCVLFISTLRTCVGVTCARLSSSLRWCVAYRRALVQRPLPGLRVATYQPAIQRPSLPLCCLAVTLLYSPPRQAVKGCQALPSLPPLPSLHDADPPAPSASSPLVPPSAPQTTSRHTAMTRAVHLSRHEHSSAMHTLPSCA